MNVVVAAFDAEALVDLGARLADAGIATDGEVTGEQALVDRLAVTSDAIVVTGKRWHEVVTLADAALALGRPTVALLTDAGLGALHPAFRRGAAAVLPADVGSRPLVAALLAVNAGLRVLAAAGQAPLSEQRSSEHRLSAREREVLELVAAGLPTKAIARRLELSPNTVKHHVAATFRKLDVRTRAEAYAAALRRGELSV